MIVIYKIFNTLNGKSYVGSTINYNRRIKRHFFLLKENRHHSIKLQNSYNKYGKDNFKHEIIEFSSVDDLIINEQKWINILNPELNMTLVAGLNSHLGLKRSEETKKKISNSLIGRSLSEEHKESVRKTLTGRSLSEEHKLNIKNGLNNSEKFKLSRENKELYQKIKQTRIDNNSYIISEEVKQKISETLKSKNLQSAISITIEKYSLDGELLCIYPSMLKAEIDNNIGRSGLYYNIVKKNKKEYKGYIWKIINT